MDNGVGSPPCLTPSSAFLAVRSVILRVWSKLDGHHVFDDREILTGNQDALGWSQFLWRWSGMRKRAGVATNADTKGVLDVKLGKKEEYLMLEKLLIHT